MTRSTPITRQASGPQTDGSNVLAVIPCLNEEAHLEEVLNSLLADETLPHMRVAVVDGGSTDRSVEIVQRISQYDPRVQLMKNPERLQSAAVNLAARTLGAGCQWLVRLDGHCDYPAGFVRTLLTSAERTGADSVVVAMRAEGKTCFQVGAAVAQNSPIGTGGAAHRGGTTSGWVDHGHHALFSLESFLAAKGYNRCFSHNEDAEYDIRLAARGGRIWLESGAEIVYYPRRSFGALFQQYMKYGAGRAKTSRLHRRRLKLRQILPLGVPLAAALAPFSVLAWPLGIPAALWAVASLASGVLVGLKSRRLCGFLSGPIAMVMHFAWAYGFLRETLLSRGKSTQLVAYPE